MVCLVVHYDNIALPLPTPRTTLLRGSYSGVALTYPLVAFRLRHLRGGPIGKHRYMMCSAYGVVLDVGDAMHGSGFTLDNPLHDANGRTLAGGKAAAVRTAHPGVALADLPPGPYLIRSGELQGDSRKNARQGDGYTGVTRAAGQTTALTFRPGPLAVVVRDADGSTLGSGNDVLAQGAPGRSGVRRSFATLGNANIRAPGPEVPPIFNVPVQTWPTSHARPQPPMRTALR